MLTVQELRYRLSATDTGFRQTMANAVNQVQTFGQRVQENARILRNWGLALTGIGSGIAYAMKRIVDSTGQAAASVKDVSNQIGFAADSLQRLRFAAEQSGLATQQLDAAMRAFVRRSAEAAQGNRAFLAFFERIGLSQEEVQAGLADTEELFLRVADGIAQLPTTAEQSAVAMALLGDVGRQMVPMLAGGRQEIERLMRQAEELGIVLDRNNIERFAEYDSTVQRFRAGLSGLRMQVATAILPIFERLARGAETNVKAAVAWVKENKDLIAQGVVLVSTFTALATGLGAVALGASLGVRALGMVTTAVSFLMSPLGLLITLVGLLALAWSEDWGGIQSSVTGAWEAISPILDAIREWEKRIIKTVWQWVIEGLNWMSNEFIPWFKSLPTRIRNTWTWAVEGLGDLREAAALAIDKAVTWTVNLVRGAWNAVSDWVNRTVTWTVNLARGVATAVADWLERSVVWLVDLAKGSYSAVADWLSGTVTWTVDLVRGTSERVREWINRVVDWTVNLARVTADKASAAAQWLLGLVEGRAEARTLTTDVDLELQEAAPGWGDRLETWLRRQLHALEWREISEEEFLRLREELGEQADNLLKVEDGRFFRATPERLEMAAEFVLNLGNSVVAFIAGRAAYDTLTAALRALLSGLGWVWGTLATGATGWLLPALGWTAAITLTLWAGFELLPEETQQSLIEFFEGLFNNDLASYIKAALGAGAALLTGIAVGANALTITLAGVLAFAIGLIDWDFIAAKIEPLWEKFKTWYRGKEEQYGWEPGEHGFIAFGLRLVFDILGIDWNFSPEAEKALDIGGEALRSAPVIGPILRSIDAVRSLRRSAPTPTDTGEVFGPPPPPQGARLNDATADLLARLVQAEAGIDGFEGMLAAAAVVLNRVASEEFPDSIEGVIYQTNAFESVLNGTINTIEATEKAFEAVKQAFEGVDPTGGATYFWNPHIASDESGWFRSAVASGELSFTTSIGRHDFFRGAQDTGYSWADGLRASIPEIIRAAEEAAQPVADRLIGQSPPSIGPLSEIDVGGERVIHAWADGLRSGAERVRNVVTELLQWIADRMIGQSPPPEGPLKDMDEGGAPIFASWFADVRDEIDRQGGGLTATLRVLVEKMFDGLVGILEKRYPEVAAFLQKMRDDMTTTLDEVEERFGGDGGSIADGIRQIRQESILWTDQLVRGLSDAIAYGRSLTDVFDNFLRMLASQFLQTRVFGPLLNSFLPGVLSGLPVFHAGGLVLGGAGALVMHNGGMVRPLARDEVPAILQTGERVLSRSQNDRFEQMLEEGREVQVHVNINAVDAKSFFDLVSRNPEAIKWVFLQDLSGNGELRRAIKSIR